MYVCVCVSVCLLGRLIVDCVAASVLLFSPITVSSSNAAPVITIFGLGINSLSVRAVRFEPAKTCSVLTANATPGTVAGVGIVNSGVDESAIFVVQSSAFAPGSYAVCVDYLSNPVNGSFVKVGLSQQLLIGELLKFVCTCVALGSLVLVFACIDVCSVVEFVFACDGVE